MVTTVNKEQLAGTEAVISCTVKGLTKQLQTVKWTKSDNSPVISGQDGLTIDSGTFSVSSQTTTLTVAGPQNNLDTTYNCVITAHEHGFVDKSTTINLKVFSKFLKQPQFPSKENRDLAIWKIDKVDMLITKKKE